MGYRSRLLKREHRESFRRRLIEEPPNENIDGAPVHKVPFELLTDIFKIAVYEERKNLALGRRRGPNQKLDHEGFPMAPIQTRISHVCGYWRSIAMDTPELWTRITFREEEIVEQAEEWMDRAKDRPLDIVMDIRKSRRRFFKFSLFDIDTILSFVLSISDRWRTFELSTDDTRMAYRVLDELQSLSYTPNLEEFTVYCTQDKEGVHENRTMYPCSFIGNAPNLRALRLWGVRMDLRTWPTELSSAHNRWSNLKELSLSFQPGLHVNFPASHSEFSSLLRACHGLEALHLKSFKIDLRGHDPQHLLEDAIDRLDLRVLELANMELRDVNNFLQLFKTVKARQLVLSLDKEDFSTLLFSIHGTPANSAFMLKFMRLLAGVSFLRLKAFACCKEAAVMLYLGCDKIEQLYLDMDRVMPELLPILGTKDALGSMMCSELLTVTLANLSVDQCWQLHDVARSRRSFGSPLANVELDASIDVPQSCLQKIVSEVASVKFVEIEGERDEDDEEGAEVGRNAVPRPHRQLVYYDHATQQVAEEQLVAALEGGLDEAALADLVVLFENGQALQRRRRSLPLPEYLNRMFKMSMLFAILVACHIRYYHAGSY